MAGGRAWLAGSGYFSSSNLFRSRERGRTAGWLAGWVGGIFSRFRSERKPDLQTVVDIESKRRLALCLFLCASCLDQFIMVNCYESGVRFRACHWRRRLVIILYSPFRNVIFRDCGSGRCETPNMTPVSNYSRWVVRAGKIDDLSECGANEWISFLSSIFRYF